MKADLTDEFRTYMQTDEGLTKVTHVVLSYISAVDDVVDWVTADQTEFVGPGIHAAMLKHLPEKFEQDPQVVEAVKDLIRVFRSTLRADYDLAIDTLGNNPRCECGTFKHVEWTGCFSLVCGNCGEQEEVLVDGRTAGGFGSA